MPSKSNQAYRITYPFIKEAQESPKFPSARYFQVHFEYLESQLSDNRHELEVLQQQVATLYTQLRLLTSALNEQKEIK